MDEMIGAPSCVKAVKEKHLRRFPRLQKILSLGNEARLPQAERQGMFVSHQKLIRVAFL